MVFPVAVYGCERWTIKKAECWRTDAFEIWCWRRLLSPLDCKEIKPVNPQGNQSWIFIGRTDAEAETPIPWPFDVKNWLTGKILMLGNIEGRRRRGQQRMSWLDGIIDSVDTSLSKLQVLVMNREAWHGVVHGVAKSQTRLRDWTELKCYKLQTRGVSFPSKPLRVYHFPQCHYTRNLSVISCSPLLFIPTWCHHQNL